MMKSAHKIITIAQWLFGFIIFILSIVGVSSRAWGVSSDHMLLRIDFFIAILSFTLILGVVAVVGIYVRKKSGYNNYDVEQSEGGKKAGGADNEGFEKESTDVTAGGEAKQKGPGGKWTKNYVPFKGFPKGSSKQEQHENSVEVVNEVGGGDATEKKDAEKSEAKWKKNYVPYQEPDSNKQ